MVQYLNKRTYLGHWWSINDVCLCFVFSVHTLWLTVLQMSVFSIEAVLNRLWICCCWSSLCRLISASPGLRKPVVPVKGLTGSEWSSASSWEHTKQHYRLVGHGWIFSPPSCWMTVNSFGSQKHVFRTSSERPLPTHRTQPLFAVNINCNSYVILSVVA